MVRRVDNKLFARLSVIITTVTSESTSELIICDKIRPPYKRTKCLLYIH